jgi:hypothetical protein
LIVGHKSNDQYPCKKRETKNIEGRKGRRPSEDRDWIVEATNQETSTMANTRC